MAHSVNLSWTASTDPVSGYNIYKGTVSGQETTLVNTALITGTTYNDTSEGPGVLFYVARSVLNGVESINSNEVKATILPAAPTALTVVSVV